MDLLTLLVDQLHPSTMGGANAQGRSLDKRIRSRIAFFVESSTSEKKCLAEAKKRLTHFIRLALGTQNLVTPTCFAFQLKLQINIFNVVLSMAKVIVLHNLCPERLIYHIIILKV